MKVGPFGFDLSADAGVFDSHLRRSLSDLEGYFADVAAYRNMVDSGNPVVYEVFEIDRPQVAGEIRHGLSVVHAGAVGDEYFMTKGHYHSVRGTAEIYYCLMGRGILLMENAAGEWAAEELRPGRVVYVTPYWAHRSINVGHDEEDLITFFAYPANAGHDYDAIAGKRFRKQVLRRNGNPSVVDNPARTSEAAP